MQRGELLFFLFFLSRPAGALARPLAPSPIHFILSLSFLPHARPPRSPRQPTTRALTARRVVRPAEVEAFRESAMALSICEKEDEKRGVRVGSSPAIFHSRVGLRRGEREECDFRRPSPMPLTTTRPRAGSATPLHSLHPISLVHSAPGTPQRRHNLAPPPLAVSSFLHLTEPAVAAAASTLFSAATVYTVCVYGVTLASTRRALVSGGEIRRTKRRTSPSRYQANTQPLSFKTSLFSSRNSTPPASPPPRSSRSGPPASPWSPYPPPPSSPSGPPFRRGGRPRRRPRACPRPAGSPPFQRLSPTRPSPRPRGRTSWPSTWSRPAGSCGMGRRGGCLPGILWR